MSTTNKELHIMSQVVLYLFDCLLKCNCTGAVVISIMQ